MTSVFNLILTHQPAAAVARMIAHWSEFVSAQNIVLAYGGDAAQFSAIRHANKFFVDDPRLRTRDHQREYQSYTKMFRTAADFLKQKFREYDFVRFSEYDHVPIAPDLDSRQVERLQAERADMLGYHLHRVDGTSSPHYLHHIDNPEFARFWRSMNRRKDRNVVLSCFGTGTFWTREAFCEVASMVEPAPAYMEIFLPTLAHHLGFRLRDLTDQNQFVRAFENEVVSLKEARDAGAWTLHPVKRLWLT